jgi:Zn ribbon nucleic-acid-binding protein
MISVAGTETIPFPSVLHEPTQTMLWNRVIPSLGNRCPKKNCGYVMQQTRVEHVEVSTCVCGYSVRETNAGMRAEFEMREGRR